MTSLKQFQNSSVDQARLQQIPTVTTPQPSGLDVVSSVLGQVTPTVTNAYKTFKNNETAAIKAKNLDTFSKELQDIAQSSETVEGFNYESAVRSLTNEYLAKGDGLGQDYLKIVNRDTGINPAGESSESIDARARTKEATDNGWVKSWMTPDQAETAEAAYFDSKRKTDVLASQQQELALKKAKGEIEQKEVDKQTRNSLKSLASDKYNNVLVQVNEIPNRLASGEDINAIATDFRMLGLELDQTIAQMGGVANTPGGQAIVAPLKELIQYGIDLSLGKQKVEAHQAFVSQRKAQADSILFADDAFLADYSTSKSFEFSTVDQVAAARRIAGSRNRVYNSLTDTTNKEANDVSQILPKMVDGDDESRTQAQQTVSSLVTELDSTGSELSEEERYNAAIMLSDERLWQNASPEDKAKAVDAFSLHLADDVQRGIREAVDTSGMGRFVTMSIDDNGLRVTAKPEFAGQRQVQLSVRKLNKELGRYTPALQLVSNAQGIGIEEAVKQHFGVDVGAEVQGPAEPVGLDRPLSAFQSWWNDNFVEPSVGTFEITEPRTQLERNLSPETVNPSSVEQPPQSMAAFEAEFIQAALEAGDTQEEAEAKWEQVSSPAVDTVNIGGVEMTREQAQKLLSTPAR